MISIWRHALLSNKLSVKNNEDGIEDYFNIKALEDGLTVSFSSSGCEYCVDYSNDWKTLERNTPTIVVNTGQRLSFRGDLNPVIGEGIGTFSISKKCSLCGNIMSLLYKDSFTDKKDLTGKDYAFYKLFYNCSTIINSFELQLPAEILSPLCYHSFFCGCYNLKTAPELPAMTLANDCYRGMFYDCKALLEAPELPATDLVDNCYWYMFYYCSSLTTTPKLHSTNLAPYCYHGMFYDCKNLRNITELPATTLKEGCYRSMFIGCRNFLKAPELPARKLEKECYYNLFYSNEGSPSSLNYIKMLATDISAENCLRKWVYRVQTTSGTFVKHKDMNDLPRGEYGIPLGWTIENFEDDE